jgi:hypothetical protein
VRPCVCVCVCVFVCVLCVCIIIIMINLCVVTLHRTRHDIDAESRHLKSVYLNGICLSQDCARGITSVSVSQCCVSLSLNDVGCVRGIAIGFLVFFGGGLASVFYDVSLSIIAV